MYFIVPSNVFKQQLLSLSPLTAEVLENKIRLAKENPSRNKRIHYPGLFLFSIRFTDNRKQKRLIYELRGNIINMLFILDRDYDYQDLQHYLSLLGY